MLGSSAAAVGRWLGVRLRVCVFVLHRVCVDHAATLWVASWHAWVPVACSAGVAACRHGRERRESESRIESLGGSQRLSSPPSSHSHIFIACALSVGLRSTVARACVCSLLRLLAGQIAAALVFTASPRRPPSLPFAPLLSSADLCPSARMSACVPVRARVHARVRVCASTGALVLLFTVRASSQLLR